MKRKVICNGCGGFHKGVCGESGACKTPAVEDRKLQRAFVIAANRIFGEFECNWKEFKQDFLAGLCELPDESLPKHVAMTSFDSHIWHIIVECAKIMPDETIIFQFRNGRKETVDLKEI